MSKSVKFGPGAKCLVPPDRHGYPEAKEREVRHRGVQDEGESSRVRCRERETCVEEKEEKEWRQIGELALRWV